MAAYGPSLLINDVVEVQLWAQCFDQASVNVVHYRISAAGAGGSDTLGHMVTALKLSGTAAKYASVMSSFASFRGYNSRRVSVLPSIYYSDADLTPGTVIGDPLPRQVCGFIAKKVAEPGRRKGGRLYVAFPCEVDNDNDSTPTAGYLANLAGLRSNLFSAVVFGTTGLAIPCVWHRPTTMPPTLGVSRDIIAMPYSDAWATQRRRGSFGRKNAPPV